MNRRGFTLIELLLALAIFAVVATSLGAALRQGILSWRRGRAEADVTQEARAALEGFARELRNALPVPGSGLAGQEKEIVFQTVLTLDPVQGPRMVRVRYRSSPSAAVPGEETVERSAVALLPTEAEADPVFQPLTRGPSRATFSFAYSGARAGDPPLWKPTWKDNDFLPPAVRVKFELMEDGVPDVFVKTIPLPTGRWVPWKEDEL